MIKKIVVWGINETILQYIRSSIDPRKAKIIFFVDSDKSKIGNRYMDIPVVELSMIDICNIDYFFVTAFSAYTEIRKQLLDYGVEKRRIQLFVTKEIRSYCVGLLEDIDLEIIRNLYFEPEKTIGYVTRYQEAYKEYQTIPNFAEVPEAWYNQSTLISHACGGVVNGKRIEYSNSREAFRYSIDSGFELIECDIMFTGSKELILVHGGYEAFYRSQEEQYSMMTVKDLLVELKRHPRVKCLIDVKWDSVEDYITCLRETKSIIKEIGNSAEEYERLQKQVIMEVYDETTIVMALKEGFEVLFTQYRNADDANYMEIVNLCNKYGIKAIAFVNVWRVYQKKFMRIFTDKNIKIFVFCSNSVDEYRRLRKAGITGVFTDYLTKEDIEKGNVR